MIADFWYKNHLVGKVVRLDQNMIGLASPEGTLVLPQAFYGFIQYNPGWQHGLIRPNYVQIHRGGPFWSSREGTIAYRVGGGRIVIDPDASPFLSDFHAGMCLKVSRRILEEEVSLSGIS